MPRRALCGSVITTNLPASTAIVNIDARADGAAASDGPQDHWYHPFSSAGAGSLLEYTVLPGTYEFRLTKPSLATVEFPALTSDQLQQLFTAWSYNNPWVTDYMVFDVSAATNTSEAQIFAGGVVSTTYGSAEAAFDAAVAGGYANKIIVGPGGRYTGTPATQYTFTAAETLVFAVPDYGLGDNAGGVSIVISPASAAGQLGDYNEDGTVDAADYTVWRNTLGSTTDLRANGDNFGASANIIDQADYAFWKANFGQGTGGGSSAIANTAVPEPATLVLLVFAVASWCFRTRRAK